MNCKKLVKSVFVFLSFYCFALYSAPYFAFRSDKATTVWDIATGKKAYMCNDSFKPPRDNPHLFLGACCFKRAQDASMFAAEDISKFAILGENGGVRLRSMFKKFKKDPIVQMKVVGNVVAWVSDKDRVFVHDFFEDDCCSHSFFRGDCKGLFPRIELCKEDPNIVFFWRRRSWLTVFKLDEDGTVSWKENFRMGKYKSRERIEFCCSIPGSYKVFVVTSEGIYKNKIKYFRYRFIDILDPNYWYQEDWKTSDIRFVSVHAKNPDYVSIVSSTCVRVMKKEERKEKWRLITIFQRNFENCIFADFDVSRENTITCVFSSGEVCRYNFVTQREEVGVVLQGARKIFEQCDHLPGQSRFAYNGNEKKPC